MNSMERKLEVLRISNEESNLITRESIQTALIYLLVKKDIADITVTELVKRAGVSRAAFYRNYKSTKDVLYDFSKNVLELLASSLKDDEYIENINAWYVFLFQQIKKNFKLISLLIKAKIDFSSQLLTLPENIDSITRYQLIALESGLLSIIDKWMANGMQESPNEMADLCEKIFVQTNLIVKK